jgi:GNAT superfamily N-acetyltransferase
MNNEQVEELMRHHPRNSFPLFDEKHKVQVSKSGSCIGYRTTAETLGSIDGTTHFDIQIIGNICYILWLELERDKRGTGDGWKLYETVHQFARDARMKSVRQTPSGGFIHGGKMIETRREYLLKRGYAPFGELEVELALGN